MKTISILQLLKQYKIVIPPIQRDYAHGRTTGKIPHIRERFLNAIVDTLQGNQSKSLELDFVYGYTEQDKTGNNQEVTFFKPLDGQQRLTTLFLLHWYIAHKEGVIAENKETLGKFSYATRHSSKLFCEKLLHFTPVIGSKPIDKQIINEPWFFSAWLNDPTINSMLVVLKDIENKCNDLPEVWNKLSGDNPVISFYRLPMDDLGLPDDLYIKMNSRGKELTDFEHFKSQFSDLLDKDHASIFNQKMDNQWSNMFWNIFKDKKVDDLAKEVDAGFLSFFWYITNLIIAKNKIVIKSKYWLDKINEVYFEKPLNVDFLFNCLNLFEELENRDTDYFSACFYINEVDFNTNKTRLFFNGAQTNLFRKCVETYGYENKSNGFSVGEQLMLYAIIYAELNEKQNLPLILRKLRNLFSSSEDQLRNEFLATFLYDDVESLINKNTLSANSKLSKRQIEEETKKAEFLLINPDLLEVINKLEDHTLLRGSIAIFNLDTTLTTYANIFNNIFKQGCNYLNISMAMLNLGDYSQEYGKLRRFGNKNNSTWRQLFTPNDYRKGFNRTKTVLNQYLNLFEQNNELTDQAIIDAFLHQFTNNPALPKNWIYYYIKYDSFKLWNDEQTDGFYQWSDINTKPYECTMLFRTQYNGRHWCPYLLELFDFSTKYSLENYGNNLQYTNGELILIIKSTNLGFLYSAKDDYSKSFLNSLISKGHLNADSVLQINQDANGIDVEDRIEKANNFLLNILQNENNL